MSIGLATLAKFILCEGPRHEATSGALARAFAGGGMRSVRSLRLGGGADATAWLESDGWWLSTKAGPDEPPS